ncbi:MAG TPA: ABC transporter permease [Candidatus Dormibacteraeota bacterium]|nr:ABC transporter permease [Candidatus Dormibacteraeota bacterium]
MLRMLLNRLAFSILALLFVGLLLFVLTRGVPGSPARVALGLEATDTQIAQFEKDHGLDRPVVEQYIRWLGQLVLHGDFGRSFVTGRSMNALLTETLPITLELVLFAFAFAVAVALPIGVLSAVYEGTWIDHAARIFAVIGVSVPGFWLGLMLIRFPAVEFGWFPPGGFVPLSDGLVAHLQSIALPAFALGVYYIAILSRMTRSGLVETLGSEYVRTARALGLPRGRVLWYALKNALVPVVSVGAMSFGYMFGWALIVEYLFNIPGMSNALLTAVGQRDYFTMQAVVYVFTIVFIVSNLAADLLNRQLNPKLASAQP